MEITIIADFGHAVWAADLVRFRETNMGDVDHGNACGIQFGSDVVDMSNLAGFGPQLVRLRPNFSKTEFAHLSNAMLAKTSSSTLRWHEYGTFQSTRERASTIQYISVQHQGRRPMPSKRPVFGSCESPMSVDVARGAGVSCRSSTCTLRGPFSRRATMVVPMRHPVVGRSRALHLDTQGNK